jgi:hypothetical protein
MPTTRFHDDLGRDPDSAVTIRAPSRRRWLTAVLLAACAGGCGPGGGGAPIPLADLPAQITDAVCNWRVGCSQSPDKATCLRNVQIEPGFFPTVEADVASGKVVYDGSKARACVDLLNRLAACTQSATATVTDEVPDACDAVFKGTVAAGGACFFKEECAGGASCVRTDPSCAQACCAGTCNAPTTAPAMAGESCTGRPCATGLYCDTSAAAPTCARQLTTAGAQCGVSGACASPLFCDLDAASGTGTCKHAVATGAHCNPTVGSASCDDLHDRCDATTSTCVTPAAVGAACDATMVRACVAYATCTAGTCVAQPEAGDSCDSTGPPCYSGLICDSTTLKCTLTPEGGACM